MKARSLSIAILLSRCVMHLAIPQEPEVGPLIEIHPAVELVFPTQPQNRYTLLQSSNLTIWEEIETEIEGTGEPIRRFQRSSPIRMFYQVEASTVTTNRLEFRNLFATTTRLWMNFGESFSGTLKFTDDGRYTVTGNQQEVGTIAYTNRVQNTWHFSAIAESGEVLNGNAEIEFTIENKGTIAVTRTNGSVSFGTLLYFNNTPLADLTDLTGERLYFSPNVTGAFSFDFLSPTEVKVWDTKVGTYVYESGVLKLRFPPEVGDFDITFSLENATILYRDQTFGIELTESVHYLFDSFMLIP